MISADVKQEIKELVAISCNILCVKNLNDRQCKAGVYSSI